MSNEPKQTDKQQAPVAVRSSDGLAGILREKYTLLKPCCVEDTPDAHTVWLKVGVQSFCLTPLACDTQEEAEWFRTQLATALAALVSANAQDQRPGEQPKS